MYQVRGIYIYIYLDRSHQKQFVGLFRFLFCLFGGLGQYVAVPVLRCVLRLCQQNLVLRLGEGAVANILPYEWTSKSYTIHSRRTNVRKGRSRVSAIVFPCTQVV